MPAEHRGEWPFAPMLRCGHKAPIEPSAYPVVFGIGSEPSLQSSRGRIALPGQSTDDETEEAELNQVDNPSTMNIVFRNVAVMPGGCVTIGATIGSGIATNNSEILWPRRRHLPRGNCRTRLIHIIVGPVRQQDARPFHTYRPSVRLAVDGIM